MSNFFLNYNKYLIKNINSVNFNELVKIAKLIVNIRKKNKKIILLGNGGSAAIASHVSVDLTKAGNIRSINFNEADLITCFANDYGFENWISKAMEFYGNEGDLLILISSSGKSENMLNAAKNARELKFSYIATFSGFEERNPLSQLGDLNIWVDSKAYNLVENIHQLWLLSLVDLVIGDKEYSA